MEAQKETFVRSLVTGVIKHIIDTMDAQTVPFWSTYKQTFSSIDHHMSLKEKLMDQDGVELDILRKHEEFYQLLKIDVDRLEDAEGLPNLMSEREILTLELFKKEMGGNLEHTISKIKEDKYLAPQVSRITDTLYAHEYAMKRLIVECDTHRDPAYVEHIGKFNLVLRDNKF